MEVDEARGVDIVLHPGEMSLHHVRMFHGSPPNRSADRRIGYAIRYIPPRIKQVAGTRDSATLVRGARSSTEGRPQSASGRPAYGTRSTTGTGEWRAASGITASPARSVTTEA